MAHRKIFPPGFEDSHEKAKRPTVELITKLLERDPHKRPSALELLESDLIPNTLIESDLRMVLKNMQVCTCVFMCINMCVLICVRMCDT